MFTIKFGISTDFDSKTILSAYDDTENVRKSKRKEKQSSNPFLPKLGSPQSPIKDQAFLL